MIAKASFLFCYVFRTNLQV